MKFKSSFAVALALATSGLVAAPQIVRAEAPKPLLQHRQATKNQWRNLTYLAGALGLLGLVKGDNTLFFGGLAGALYSASRYEHDRKSQSKQDRFRAQVFSHSYIYRNGVRYDRHVTYKKGHKYYYFARHHA